MAAAETLRAVVERRDELVAFVRRRAPADVDPEDVLQHALLTATKNVATLREPDLVLAWFYRILRRSLADHYARSAAWREKLPIVVAGADAATGVTDLCGCSLGLVDTLAPGYAEVLRRIDIDEEDIADVAVALGTTTNNVTVRLCRARKSLRERLASTCGTTSLASCLDCDCL